MDLTALFVPLALLAGGLLNVQAGSNLQLRIATGSSLAASTLQLGVGAVVLLVVMALAGTFGSLGLLAGVPWWHLLGGLGSAIYITATILLFPRLGAVVSVGLFIVGQMLASVLLDLLGLLGVARRPLGLGDVLGVLAVVFAAAVIVRSQEGSSSPVAGHRSQAGRAGWVVLGVVAGAALPVQGAVNALLRADLGVPVTVGAISFVVATLAMVLLLVPAVTLGGEPRPNVEPLTKVPWWGWLGGICGAIYVTSVFTALPILGAALVVGLTVAGQQIVAALFDRYGLMRLPRRPVTTARLVGISLLLAGVALIQFA